ncbi:hypothetical protein K505DRAFT_86493 [Melanomma pulvis-pyrius CBS 109.77]|uniref:Uncharacterized protein n=1 Tax=Melanomma pulvis-pyrius CBS 109.77 TaxID=1314802 RepID=A0A6A6X1A9_9PLEO|nr:hypothetical protein K505DRAFT_86493 [Melanomma pulvis-pyrius CBS 109.77]
MPLPISLQAARRVTPGIVTGRLQDTFSLSRPALSRVYSSAPHKGSEPLKDEPAIPSTKYSEVSAIKEKKTQAELDKELELKMQGLSGDGGESGVEFEDGKPVAMKRSVRNNMFRYI